MDTFTTLLESLSSDPATSDDAHDLPSPSFEDILVDEERYGGGTTSAWAPHYAYFDEGVDAGPMNSERYTDHRLSQAEVV
ncbi:hypothetical protein CCMSSC00406_0008484 [Pleurotus cornucopiae]|uniref:Uncharacterized protein n=1 Tax=Pleurotus cornucopiae TaxID=5321 RepID=A0ACB7IGS7_PLECO|nr:hypothetical protein CCMSSC00406_0008484 [Pleurotus cornucopiae]